MGKYKLKMHCIYLDRLKLIKNRNVHERTRNDRMIQFKSRRPDLPGTGIKASEETSAGLNFQQTLLTSAIAKE